nr:CDPK-related kinase 3 [Tanacetum cinerariifolium]
MSKDVRSLALIECSSEWTWETDKGNDTTNGILRSYGINWLTSVTSPEFVNCDDKTKELNVGPTAHSLLKDWIRSYGKLSLCWDFKSS